jgi:hypothetical protein
LLGLIRFSNQGRPGAIAAQAKANAFAKPLAPILIEMQDRGMSLRQMAETLTNRGILAPQGGPWRAVSLRRVIARVNQAAGPEAPWKRV